MITALQIQKEHKSKLLEMCKELFPEYIHHYPNNDGILYMFKPEYDDEDPQETYIGEEINIHWFEFCMTHLINALAWKNITSDIIADCQYEETRLKYLLELGKDRPNPGQYHPVDYLHEEFKKIKG